MAYRQSGENQKKSDLEHKGPKVLESITRPAGRVSLNTLRIEKANEKSVTESLQNNSEGVVSGGGKSGFWHELLSELMFLEATSAYWALKAANPVDLGFQELQQLLQLGQLRQVGESVCEEYLTCLDCAHYYYVYGTATIEVCECGGQHFEVGVRH